MRARLVVGAAVVLLGLVVLRSTVADTIRITSGSMAPTVCTDGLVVVDHLAPAADLTAGDVVTFRRPGDGAVQIKRVVALAGQSVGIADADLVVDGAVVAEPYVDAASIDGVYFGPVTVPSGSVFLMGDDRERSVDSRAFGPVPLTSIDGRLVTVLSSSCPDDRLA